MSVKKRITGVILILITLFCLAGCAVHPVTLEKELMIISEEKEIAIGKRSDPFILQEFGYYDDPALQDYVSRIGQKLVRFCPRRDIEYHFKIVDSDDIRVKVRPTSEFYPITTIIC